MRTQHPNGTLEEGAPAVRSWRLLLLILLVLLPATVAMASPEPGHALSASNGQYTADVHPHGPSDTPACHHAGHHGNTPALVSDIRDLELPTSGDGLAAIPDQRPAQNHPNVANDFSGTATAETSRPALPIYLRTRRLRV